jgi:hypothetical protein
MVHQIDQNG